MNTPANTGWPVAPHGTLMFAVFAMLIIIGLHVLGFRIVAAVKIGR